jgi:uncharacterized protein (DUF1330 family)
MTLVQIVRIPVDGVDAFQAYESLVLPMLARHGGRLERRLRTADARVEIHILSFASQERLETYLADPQRAQHLHLREQSGAETELFEVTDISID